MTININAANITSIRLAEQSSNPSTPASGFASLFVDTNGDLATRKDAGGIKIATSPASGDYILTVDGTGTAARLNANNVFTGSNQFSNTIAVGGVAPAASGSGVTFPANFAASSDVNTLDDYEEGNWTPVVVGSGTAGTATYSVATGRYTKIGRMVHIQADLGWSGGSGGGNLYVQGLPFTSSGVYSTVTIGYWDDIVLTASSVVTSYVQFSTQEIRFAQYPLGGGATSFVPYDAAGRMFIQGVYIV